MLRIEAARAVIAESWRRCKAAGIDPAAPPRFRRVTDLPARLARAAELLELAKPRLYALLKSLPGATNIVYAADADGVILFSLGDQTQLAHFGLTPGYDWSEPAVGTNGVGTALALRAPVAVLGEEHFIQAFAGATCTAAPVFARERLVGAIDVSSSAADARPERLAQVTALAQEIEAELSARRLSR